MMKHISRCNSVSGIAGMPGSVFSKQRASHSWIMPMLFLLTLSGMIILTGCSGGGGGGGEATAPGGTTNDTTNNTGYTGSAKISGSVALSSLSSSDSAQVSSNAPSARAKVSKDVDTQTEAVKLYVMGSNGELEDTGISCTISSGQNGDRNYECDGVKDGVNYIVRYVKVTGTGKALDMKSNAYVPKGSATPTGTTNISPQTSVVVKALVDAILNATAGTDITDSVVNTIIQSVKTAIETLVSSGAIQIPSVVVDVDKSTTLTDIVGKDTKNENLDNAVGVVLTDGTVGSQIGYVTAANDASKFDLSSVKTDADKEALIRKVFKDLLKDDKGDSDDMPGFYYKFFTWLYVNNSTFKAGDLLNVLINTMQYSPNAINKDKVTTANAIAMFNNKISEINALIAKDASLLTDAEKKKLAETPGVIRGLFPSGFPAIETSTDLITPRAIAFVIFFDKIFMKATVVPAVQNLEGTTDAGGKITYTEGEYYRWDDKALFTYLGMGNYMKAHPEQFTGIDIVNLHLHPGSIWIESTKQETDALMLNVNLMNLDSIGKQGGNPELGGSSGATVTLTYPKRSGGTGTINLVYIMNMHSWGLDPFAEANSGNQPTSGPPPINVSRVVSDFMSGTYTVTVVYNGKTTTKSFTKSVITGMSDKYAKLTTPAGMPNWPGPNASQTKLDAFNIAMEAFNRNGGRTNFTANVMDDGSAPASGQKPTKAKITLAWEAPDVTLPDGVKMVYNIDIGRSSCDDNGNCMWTPVWNSWNTNKRIYSTSFTVPYLFNIQTGEDALRNPYSVNVNVSFIDQKTGDQLGNGGHSHADFSVGEPIDTTKEFTIRGLNAITINDTSVSASHLKAALVKETRSGTSFSKTILKIANLNGETGYSLTFQIKDFLGSATANTSYNLVLIDDANGTLAAGDSIGNTTITFWPDNTGGHLWFDTWGGVLKVNKDQCDGSGKCANEQKIIVGGETIDGPRFYIGKNIYQPPDPNNVTAVPADTLAKDFKIQGNVNVAGVTNPVVVLVKEGFDMTVGYNIQTVIRIGTISSGKYQIAAKVGDFYDANGKPVNKMFQVLLVSDKSPSVVTIGSPLGNIPTYWPDWMKGGFGFDTWRGTQLYVFADTYNADTKIWTHNSWGVPGDTTTVTGPELALNAPTPIQTPKPRKRA